MTSIGEILAQAYAHHQAGRLAQAEPLYREAIRHMPGLAALHNNLGAVLKDLGQMEGAAAAYREAIRLMPGLVEAHYNLAIALQALDQHEEAAVSYREAIRLKPDHVEAHSNLANALHYLGRSEEGVAYLREAIRLRPDYVHAHFNLGVVMQALGRHEEAAAACREALRLKPDHAEAHITLANALEALGRPAEVAVCLREAIRLKPDAVDAHFHLSLTHLRLGNFKEGWLGYEWRWRADGVTTAPWMTPDAVWEGSALGGRTILVFGEQGLGDTLQFIRYVSLVKERGGRVIVACQEALVRLLAGCAGIDQVVPLSSAVPPFDFWAPLMSLPRIFGTTPATIPAAVPYLVADAHLTDTWRRRLAGVAGFKVGINWRGRSSNAMERLRCIPLKSLEPLARVPGVQLIRLQKNRKEDLEGVEWNSAVLDLGELDEASGPFMDTAAVMKNLDLVISSDTSVAHLAGGLGIPVWVGVPFVSDWRWIVGREDSPWYPTLRLFQQREAGNWDEVFERMACELEKRVAERPNVGPRLPASLSET